jgi:diaminopimelate decarboxylase
VFSGVGKSAAEMRLALEHNVMCFNVESVAELVRLNEVALSLRDANGKARRAPISLRINPDVDAKTHPYISTGLKGNKFGVSHNDALAVYQLAASLPGIEVVGIDCHIGSQITDGSPYLDALDRLLDLVEACEAGGIAIHHIDMGGGIGIRYDDEAPPAADAVWQHMITRINARGHAGKTLLAEPGRSILGNAGVLLTRVEYLKPGDTKNFAIVDAAMNDLMRPALYQSYHAMMPAVQRDVAVSRVDVVGPVCESGDWLGRDRDLAVEQGDVIAILSAGAYGMAMASNYNTRPRSAEVLVDGATPHLIRQRETVEQLFAGERLV